MSFDDDDLSGFLRRMDPAMTPEDAPLTAAHLALRDRITAEAPRALSDATSRGPRLSTLMMTTAAAVVVLALVVAFSAVSVPGAVALTPSPLTFTETAYTPKELLTIIQDALAAGGSLSEPRREATSSGWYLQLDRNDDATATATALISPQVTALQWAPDQSGHVTVVAGSPYWADGSDNPLRTTDTPIAGTVLTDMAIPAGTLGAPTVEPPGSTLGEMTAWLSVMGLPADASAADLIDSINLAMSYWTMTNQQHSLLLQLLLQRDDVQVVGTSIDRAGRPVIGVAADSARFPGTRRLLLISADTGRIVAEEVLRNTPDGNLPAGSVILYTLWDLPPI